MPEYVGLARATLAWVGWIEGDAERCAAEARAALDAYAASAFAVFPWEWTARLPLLAVALEDGRIDDGKEQARAMLDPQQQPLATDVETAMREAVGARPSLAEQRLRRSIELAVAAGLL
jgi:hypothetical protein